VVPFAAIFSDLLPNHGDSAEDETEEAEAGGHLVVAYEEIDDFAEKQNTYSHSQNQREQEETVFLYILEKVPESIKGLLIKTENDEENAAAETGSDAADTNNYSFKKILQVFASGVKLLTNSIS